MSYDYHAFLSCSRRDEQVAEELQQALSKLMKRPLRRKSLRIFRDRTGLQAGGGLEQRLKSALDRSGSLILLLSRQAAASPWVDAEIRYWLGTRPSAADRLVVVRCDSEVDLRWDASGAPVSPATLPPALA